MNSIDKETEKHSKTTASLVRHSSILSILTLISRVLGLVREMTKARFLGTSALSDAFSVAFLLPNLFRRLFAEGSISVAFIPTFKEYLLKKDEKATKEFFACIFTFLTFFVTIMVMAGVLAAPLLVKIFGVEEYKETVMLTRIMFPFLGFISLAALFQGVLNSHNIFTPTGIAPILLNIITILSAYFLSPFTANPARAMAYGVLFGGFMSAAIQLPFVIKQGNRLLITGIKRAFNNPGTRKVLRLIAPTIIGMAAYQLNDLVSTALAGRAGIGIVSSLQYSLRLQELILGVFAVSIGTVLLPNLAEYAKSSQWENFKNRLISAIKVIALITIPITFFSLVCGESLIRLLFQNRLFDDESVRLTLSAFTFHMLGMFFIALNRILAPAFYAQSDTKSPTLAGIIAFAVNIILASILVRFYQGAGIAVSLSIASAINTLVLFIFLKRKKSITFDSEFKTIPMYVLKLCIFSALAVIPINFLSPVLLGFFAERGRIISYGIPLGINVIIYIMIGVGMLAITKDRYFLSLVKLLKRKRDY